MCVVTMYECSIRWDGSLIVVLQEAGAASAVEGESKLVDEQTPTQDTEVNPVYVNWHW